ncbi:pentapeptide repeat-containing protein [Nostoc sp.]|uniref:pentapeptide repeat-containing protein n=1 Tax=Nostoc sp. TaxID=1180 RepID=UPI002FFA3CCA
MGATLPQHKPKKTRLLRLIPRIPHKLIEAKASEIYEGRKREGRSDTPEDDWFKALELLEKDWWTVTRWKLEERYQKFKDSAKNSTKDALTFKSLSQAVNASVLIGAVTFIASEQQRRDIQVYQAWQVITVAHKQPGSGGRVQALEFLNSEPRRIPWFWLHWERESLESLEVPNAYLIPSRKNVKKPGIQLSKAELNKANLQEIFLTKANLQGAFLQGAKLQGAFLQRAYLQEAHLLGAYLQGTNLTDAKLQGAYLQYTYLQGAILRDANLQGTNLQGAHYTDKSTSQQMCKAFSKEYPCPTIFPKGFNPKTAGMILEK